MSVILEETVDSAAIASATTKRRSLWAAAIRNTSVIFGGSILIFMIVIAVLAPYLGTVDPTRIDPASRNKNPGTEITVRLDDGTSVKRIALMGTDSLGRDVYSRVIYGTRVSLTIGIAVSLIAVSVGLVIGLVAGYIRWADGIIMRIMDGLMAIPAILLAIALVSIWRAGLITVIFAIVVPEQCQRRSPGAFGGADGARGAGYVEGATSVVASPTWMVTDPAHLCPTTRGPPHRAGHFHRRRRHHHRGDPVVPRHRYPARNSELGATSWPKAARCSAFSRTTSSIPRIFLAFTVLAINIMGDGLRDTLDPKMSKRV